MVQQSQFTTQKILEPPNCPSCGRVCDPAATWKGANYCRGFALLPFIESNPGLSAWELSQVSGMSYQDATRGLAKLREYEAVLAEPEDRGDGSYRYRYWPADSPGAQDRFIANLRTAEAHQ
jgi:hypothetical protein